MNPPIAEHAGHLRPLRILSVEDEPKTVSGTISALRRDGHIVRQATDAESAHEPLRAHAFDLLLVDERLPGDSGAGLIFQLKKGYFGSGNAHAAFIVVTANPDWPPRSRLANLKGYVAISRKGSSLTPQVRDAVEDLRKQAPARGVGRLRRVITRVEALADDGATLLILIPSWRSEEPVSVPRQDVDSALYAPDEQLLGAHFFAWMNLDAASAEEIEITNFEREADDEDHNGQ